MAGGLHLFAQIHHLFVESAQRGKLPAVGDYSGMKGIGDPVQQPLFHHSHFVLQLFQFQRILFNQRFQQSQYQSSEGAGPQGSAFQRLQKGEKEAGVLDQEQPLAVQIKPDLNFRQLPGGAFGDADDSLGAVAECLQFAGRNGAEGSGYSLPYAEPSFP